MPFPAPHKTWLDRRLVDGHRPFPIVGFGTAVNEAVTRRENFLVEQGFAQRNAGGVRVRTDLLAALRERELAGLGRTLAGETGKAYHPLAEGGQAQGSTGRLCWERATASRCSMTAWRSAWCRGDRCLPNHMGQQLSATVRGNQVSWILR